MGLPKWVSSCGRGGGREETHDSPSSHRTSRSGCLGAWMIRGAAPLAGAGDARDATTALSRSRGDMVTERVGGRRRGASKLVSLSPSHQLNLSLPRKHSDDGTVTRSCETGHASLVRSDAGRPLPDLRIPHYLGSSPRCRHGRDPHHHPQVAQHTQ
jgi:hypothetical protein